MSNAIGTHRARLAVLAFAALLLGACGASGGDEVAGGSGGSTTTTSAPSGDGSTTTDPDGGDDPADPDGGEVDLDALEATLPEAAEIGPGFSVSEEDDEDDDGTDDAGDKAMEEACPGAAEFFDDIEDKDGDDDELKRTYEHTDSRQVEISIDPAGIKDMTADDIDEVAGLFNDCDEIEFEEDGATTRMDISAEVDDQSVTKGLVLHIHMEVGAPMLPAPLEVNLKGILFLVDEVGVSVMMIDGLDEATMQPVESDWDRLYELAGEMEDRVGEVVGA